MSPPVTYRPAYIGLFAALVLAVTCNAYLDIYHGTFGVEVLIWSMVYFFTLRVAWKQRGKVDEVGRRRQKVWAIVAVLATLLVFLPLWRLPRAGLWALAALQTAANCVTVDRRRFMLALLVSAVMVMFAAMHWRADWTMLFYFVPYLLAVVFTLVAEQVSRRVHEVQNDAPGQNLVGGQGASIVAATASLLIVALALYALTPQVTWVWLKSQYGQLSNLGSLRGIDPGARGGLREAGGLGGGGDDANTAGGADGRAPGGDQDLAHGAADGPSGDGYRESIRVKFGWPTVQEMRQAAKRSGMPVWQAATIRQLADAAELIERIVQPLTIKGAAISRAVGEWLEANRWSIIRGLIGVVLVLLLAGACMLVREMRLGLWLRVQFDFLRLALLRRHAAGTVGACQIFAAMQRLFALHQVEQDVRRNAREYLAALSTMHRSLRREAGEMVELFEHARYGNSAVSARQVARMCELYRQMYRCL